MDSISVSNKNVLFYDQNELFCNNKCSYIKDGMPLYRDQVHISEYGSIVLSELFVNWAQQNIPALINQN